MSDIKVGDLVMVVRKHPCTRCQFEDRLMGLIFRVAEIESVLNTICECGAPLGRKPIAIKNAGSKRGVAVARLRRLPPLSELEGEKREEEIRA